MAVDPIHIGDRGTIIIMTFKNVDVNGNPQVLDLSNPGIILRITFVKPSGIFYGPFDMTLVSDGKDGRAYYITNRTFSIWDAVGTWGWFGEVIYTDFLFRSDRVTHPVIV